jgi:YD repeat-containing protein
VTQALKTPNEQAIVGPHIRHENPHPQYALSSETVTQDELTAAVAAAVVDEMSSVVPGNNIAVENTDAGTVVSVTGGSTGLGLLDAATPRESRQIVQVEPTTSGFTYNVSGQLTLLADSYGTKALAYNGSGQLISVTGTGRYRSKSYVYSGDQLIGITVAP